MTPFFRTALLMAAMTALFVGLGGLLGGTGGAVFALIAAESTGRVCLGIELNPAYVDVAVERWQKFTGQEAVLETSGERFNNLKDNR